MKSILNNLYVGYRNGETTFTTFENSDIFDIRSTKKTLEKAITVVSKANKVFDLKRYGSILIYWPYHGGSNQRFVPILSEGGNIVIASRNLKRCLEYKKNKDRIEMSRCDKNNTNQKFSYEPALEKMEEDSSIVEISRDELDELKKSKVKCLKEQGECEKQKEACNREKIECSDNLEECESKLQECPAPAKKQPAALMISQIP